MTGKRANKCCNFADSIKIILVYFFLKYKACDLSTVPFPPFIQGIIIIFVITNVMEDFQSL